MTMDGTLDRRDFLRIGCAGACSAALPGILHASGPLAPGYKTKHVVLIAFAGGVRSRDTIGSPQNVPNLMRLAERGVVFPNTAAANLGHYGATLSIFTGIPEYMGIRDNARGFNPTIFEYLRKQKELPASEAWLSTNNGAQGINFAYGLHRKYGSRFGANVIDGDGLFNEEFREVLAQFGRPQSDSKAQAAALARLRGSIDGPGAPEGSGAVNDASTAARVEQYILDELAQDSTTRITGPGAGDAKALNVAGRILQIFRPSLLGISLSNADVAHGSYNAYVDVIRRNDQELGQILDAVDADQELRESTSFFVLPEFGRDRDLNERNGLDHGDGSPDLRQVSILAAGAGLRAGQGREVFGQDHRRVSHHLQDVRSRRRRLARQGVAQAVRVMSEDRARRSPSRLVLVALLSASSLAGGVVLSAAPAGGVSQPAPPTATNVAAGEEGCLNCHQGIEEMHPWFELSCTACHGGDPEATTKEAAHVRPRQALPRDERVLPENHDAAYLQFVNPGDLRVVERTCYECHTEVVERLRKSMHATTSGHLSDGLYENGFSRSKEDRWSIFPIRDEDGEQGPHALVSLPGFLRTWDHGRRDTLAGHAADLARKNCMECHLWNSGRALRGRLGMDGSYRGAGCSACHVTYADDGFSKSSDPTIDKFEPGHPVRHQMTLAPPTETCTRCHFGDASIGLHFRGLAQLFPGMPAGPEVPNTTDSRLNEVYYIQDRLRTPPDVHHKKGMHCIDCHTSHDVMGDGDIYGFMEHAVEIECVDCHGTIDAISNRQTSRGRPLSHLHEDNGMIYLRSKVDGRKYWIPQAAHVVDATRPEFNPRAARAMTPDHARLECYTCHAGWNVNFFGFHFDRNESFSDLDLLLGERTPGRCNTQEKVFATLEHFYVGFNDEGMIAPYLVGFSTMGTVHDQDGNVFIDQQLPVTADGLSGMTMIHHQLHSTQGAARTCVECHRAPSTLGLGSGNFRLARNFAAVTDELGLHFVAMDRQDLELSASVSRLPLKGAGQMAAVCDELQGHFQTLYVALDGAGVAVIDATNPAFPRRRELLPTSDPRDVLVRAGTLYVADGVGGVVIFDVEDVDDIEELSRTATRDARSMDLEWPHLFVADGEGGIKVFDVRDPKAPDFVAHVDTNLDPRLADDAFALDLMFQYSQPNDGRGRRTRARLLAAVAAGRDGPMLFDLTDLTAPTRLWPPPQLPGTQRRRTTARPLVFRQVKLQSRYDIGSPGGDIPTEENDYAYFLAQVAQDEGIQADLVQFRVTEPLEPERTFRETLGYGAGDLALAAFYNAPFLQRFAVVSSPRAATVIDFSRTEQVEVKGPMFGTERPVRDIVLEEFSFDRMVDERGRALKDISHPTSRYLDREEALRVLSVPLDAAEVADNLAGDELDQEQR